MNIREEALGDEPAMSASGVNEGDRTPRWCVDANRGSSKRHYNQVRAQNPNENIPSAYGLPLEVE